MDTPIQTARPKPTPPKKLEGLKAALVIVDEVAPKPEVKKPYIPTPRLMDGAFRNNPEMRELQKKLHENDKPKRTPRRAPKKQEKK